MIRYNHSRLEHREYSLINRKTGLIRKFYTVRIVFYHVIFTILPEPPPVKIGWFNKNSFLFNGSCRNISYDRLFGIGNRKYISFDLRRLCIEDRTKAFCIFFHQFIEPVSFFIQCLLPHQNAVSYPQPFVSVSNKLKRRFRYRVRLIRS